MRTRYSLLFAALLLSLPISALADVKDYLGSNENPGRCPKVLVIRPDMSDNNVFVAIDASDLQTASAMIGSAVANKYQGATVIASKDLDQYRSCNVPVLLTKLRSYTTDPGIFGQHAGTANVGILHFTAPGADAPDKEVNVSATGDRHWGDSIPFMNAIKAVCEKIQKTSLL